MSWVTVHIPADPVELVCVEAALSGAGIEYYVHGRNFAALYPGAVITGWNACLVQVQDEDLARARGVVEEVFVAPPVRPARRRASWWRRFAGAGGGG